MKIKKIRSKKIIILSSIAVIIIASCLGIYLINKAKNQNSSGGYYNPKTATPTTNVPVSTNKEGQPEGSINSAQPGNSTDSSTPSIDAATIPSPPLGTFVSNHSPNLSGNPAPNTEVSTCTTTPGAKCEIVFIQGGLTRSLQPQVTDVHGNASWSWTLQSANLNEGTWKITAIATNGNHQTSSTDATNLQVHQ